MASTRSGDASPTHPQMPLTRCTLRRVMPKIEREELPEVVAEAARLDEGFHDGEAREVLHELGISPERLEEAKRNVAIAKTRKSKIRRRLLLGFAALALVGFAVGTQYVRHRTRLTLLSEMQVTRATLTMAGAQAAGAPAGSDVELESILSHPPEGDRVELTCVWTDPAGTKQHENHWETKPVTHDAWPTHCRFRVPLDAPAGTWSVKMKQDERTLTEKTFVVEGRR